MKIATLISDWKLRDPYLSMFKGELITALPDLQIFDITHTIDLYSVKQTAFILKNSYQSFPKGSLHIILTGLAFSDIASPILLEHDGHYFMGKDNGIFFLMFNESEHKLEAFQMKEQEEKSSITKKIIQMAGWFFDNQLSDHCIAYQDFKRLLVSTVVQEENKITGSIVYLDSACNAITNIPVSLFHKIRANRSFKVTAGDRKHLVTSLYQDYYAHSDGEVYLVPNRLGFIEISIYHGNIAALANLHVDDSVEITFE